MAEPITVTWAMVLLLIGFVVTIYAQVSKMNAQSRKTWTWVGLGTAGAMVVIMVMGGGASLGLPFLDQPLTGGEGKVGTIGGTQIIYTATPAQQQTPSGVCAVEDTTVTLSSTDKYTSVAAGTTHRYRVNNNPALTVANAGTFTASPGDVINILWGNETDGSYYGEVSSLTIPCVGTKTLTTELVQNGTLTIEVFNEEGNLITTTGENETLGVGDVVTLEAKLKGQYQRGFPNGGVMVVEFNGTGSTSEVDDVVVDFGGSAVAVPSIYSITLGTESRTKAYSIPAIMSNQIITGSIVIDADDTNNPSDGSDVILTFYPKDYFVNGDNQGSFDGPAIVDEDDAQTFLHATAFTVSID